MSRAALVALALAAAPTAALGFSEPERYAEPAIDGGGGGRYFTGAPPDGLSCSVCHGGGDKPQVKIAGLPDRIDAGKRYEATLTWPDDGRPYALTLELIDADGAHPAVELLNIVDQTPDMRCDGNPTGPSAAYQVDLGTRRIIGVSKCGAHALTVVFTPPSDEDLFFAVGVVASDGSETSTGDGVLEVRRTLTATATNVACSVGGGDPTALALIGLGLAAVTRRRRRAR